MVGELTDLTSREWKDMVTFYLGCSFGMEDALDAAGIKLPAVNNNVSMYISNIPCNTSGPFSTNMVVSMRSVSKGQLQALFEATYKLDTCHGAPIHIGDSSDIGISDINDVDFGEPTDVGENDVPVFFACGVTANNAIKLAGKEQFVRSIVKTIIVGLPVMVNKVNYVDFDFRDSKIYQYLGRLS